MTRVTSPKEIHAERNNFAQAEPDEREKTEGDGVPRKKAMTEKDHHPRPALRTTYTSVDVARKAGVSRTTVSYVLNDNGTGHVSEETRKKVLQAAEELGYSTDRKSTRLNSSHQIISYAVFCLKKKK